MVKNGIYRNEKDENGEGSRKIRDWNRTVNNGGVEKTRMKEKAGEWKK